MKNLVIFSTPFHKFLLPLDSSCTIAMSPGRHIIHARSLHPPFLKSLELVMLSWDMGPRDNLETGSQPS